MFISISGEYDRAYHVAGYKQLTNVEIEAHVYSRQQAREELERFLEASGLPERTRDELTSVQHETTSTD